MTTPIKIDGGLENMLKKGSDFLQCRYPILCGAMAWVSEPNLVTAVLKAGGFASLAAGNTPADILEKQIAEIRSNTDQPFAVNLITIAPSYLTHLELVSKLNIPYIVFAGSFPKRQEVEKAKASGAKVMCFASTAAIAKRMVGFGADAIIIEGNEAGGHIGHVSTIVLLQEILFAIRDKVPVFVAGGVATGKMLAHLLTMGAAGVQLGTRFVMSEECRAHDNFKDIFRRSSARNAVSTSQYDPRLPIVGVRAISNEGMVGFGKLQLDLLKRMDEGKITREEAQEETENFWIGSLRNAVVDGDTERGSLMAGQSVGLVNDIKPVQEIINDLLNDANEEIEYIKSRLNQ